MSIYVNEMNIIDIKFNVQLWRGHFPWNQANVINSLSLINSRVIPIVQTAEEYESYWNNLNFIFCSVKTFQFPPSLSWSDVWTIVKRWWQMFYKEKMHKPDETVQLQKCMQYIECINSAAKMLYILKMYFTSWNWRRVENDTQYYSAHLFCTAQLLVFISKSIKYKINVKHQKIK